ncbi:hypothetical protein GCM10010140_71980 [Streptosporangium pseudovulgare]|uniref:Uncharacterized protein n=1 Tax=Streptosporangium pseudovulgare TaxID=35765 RepID=A0ABQ2RJS8_9ACTN|nr:hypothetical protein GCM10010140_71980 [Streptosporangium pseudovulgare]
MQSGSRISLGTGRRTTFTTSYTGSYTGWIDSLGSGMYPIFACLEWAGRGNGRSHRAAAPAASGSVLVLAWASTRAKSSSLTPRSFHGYVSHIQRFAPTYETEEAQHALGDGGRFTGGRL